MLRSESLTASAGIFFGDVLAVLDPRARWQVAAEPEIRLPGVMRPEVHGHAGPDDSSRPLHSFTHPCRSRTSCR